MKNDKHKLYLLRWLLHAVNSGDMPGAWDYDEERADLVEDTARLFNIKSPWSGEGKVEIKMLLRELQGL
jgi:hypothetical protein